LNLKQKSFLFVGISVTVLVAVYAGLSEYYLSQSTSRRLQERLQRAQNAAGNVDAFFARGIAKLDVIASLPLLLNGLSAIRPDNAGKEIPTQDTLHYLVYKSDIFTDGVYLLNDRGQIIWTEPHDQKMIGNTYAPFSELRDVVRAETGGTTFRIWPAAAGRHEDILLSVALVNRDGQVEGYLVGAIPTNHPAIVSAFESRSAPGVNMQLVSRDGVAITSTDPNRVMRQLPYPQAAVQRIETDQEGVIEPRQPVGQIIAYKSLTKAPFFITSDVPAETALEDIRALRTTLTAIGILSMTIIMATLIFVVRSFTKPVELLTEEARRIGAGHMDGSFTTNRSDELGVLAHTLQDMKERLQSSYDRLLQSEKMALIGQVVAGIAHELNNPLTIIIGHTEMMLLKGVDDQHRQPLTRIHDGAERASKIVKNLLTFARKKPPERLLSDTNKLIAKTLELRAYELKVNNIELITDLAPDLPSIMCDPHQLQQVLLNLIVNAEQAMLEANGKGRLTIRTRANNGSILIVVDDNGPGISMDNLRRVFDPFFTTKPVGKGTGLGLAICQGIVAEHGGKLRVDSTPGFGATFTVELPIAHRSHEKPVSSAVASVQKVDRPRTVLIVDDETHMRDLLADILRADGHGVFTAATGQEALDLISNNSFDMVITDMKMPDLDGAAFHKELKARNSPLASRVLFVTGDLMNPPTLRFLENCGNPWIAKPFEVSVIRDTVRRILNS